MTIRKAVIEDLDNLMNVIKIVVIDMEAKGIYQWDNIYPNVDVIKDDISKKNLYVYDDCAAIQGMIVLNEYQDKEYDDISWKHNGKVMVIHRLCIHPKYHRKGIAKKLLDFAESKGRENNYTVIRLDTFTKNKPACNMYENAGYRKAGIVTFRKGNFFCFEKIL